MYFVGTKSVYLLLYPLPGSVATEPGWGHNGTLQQGQTVIQTNFSIISAVLDTPKINVEVQMINSSKF